MAPQDVFPDAFSAIRKDFISTHDTTIVIGNDTHLELERCTLTEDHANYIHPQGLDLDHDFRPRTHLAPGETTLCRAGTFFSTVDIEGVIGYAEKGHPDKEILRVYFKNPLFGQNLFINSIENGFGGQGFKTWFRDLSTNHSIKKYVVFLTTKEDKEIPWPKS